MPEKAAYIVVVEPFLTKFMDDVNARIEEGYQPVGGIMFMEGMYYQAMLEPDVLTLLANLRGL